jgi:methylglutaconyl-CoA hydratase
MTTREAEEFVTRLRNTFEAFASLSMPTIAAIEGVAVGGGLELALAADIRFASSAAVLGLPETSLAIVPGAGGTQRLPRLIGLARAKELVFSGQRINGMTAKEYGLVQQVVGSGRVLESALDLAWKIAANGPVAIRSAKFAMDYGMTKTTLPDALEVERQAYERVLTTEDRLEGLSAFQEGRKPVYTGR